MNSSIAPPKGDCSRVSFEARATSHSNAGAGTEFSIHFPAADAAVVEASSSGRALARGKRILFLDDDAGFVELVRRLTGKAGYHVIGYSNAADALMEFSADPHAFDLVVADLSMPDMSGIDVAQRMLAIRKDIPTIITAGYISRIDEVRAVTCGVREVISKSATVEELCMAFGRALGASG